MSRLPRKAYDVRKLTQDAQITELRKLFYDIAFYVARAPADGATLFRLEVARAFSLPADCSGSRSNAVTAPGKPVFLSLQKNDVEFGSLTFAVAAADGVFSSLAASFAIGDTMRIVCMTERDATLAGISTTFVGSRS